MRESVVEAINGILNDIQLINPGTLPDYSANYLFAGSLFHHVSHRGLIRFLTD